MQIESRPVEQLIPYVRNARTHSEDQIAQIAASIAEFGFVNPVLIGADDVIVAGHGRVLAAKRLGLAEVPVIVLDHLSEAQRRALVIADNRIAENAGWDEAMLRAELAALREDEFDLDVLGFSDADLLRILDSIDGAALGGKDADETGTPPARSSASEPSAICMEARKHGVAPVLRRDTPSATSEPTGTRPKSSACGVSVYWHGGKTLPAPLSVTPSVEVVVLWRTVTDSCATPSPAPARGVKVMPTGTDLPGSMGMLAGAWARVK